MLICTSVKRGGCLCGGLTINARKSKKNPLRIDPSRTIGIQRKFMAEMKARFRKLRAAMWRFMVMDDELGLGKEAIPSLTKNAGSYKFATNPKKLIGFNIWLQNQIDQGLLSTDVNGGSNWTETYIYSAYKQGIARAYTQVNGTTPPNDKDRLKYEGGKQQFIIDSFNFPERKSTVEILATRAYNELDGVTDTMGQQMNRILSTGLINGDSPYTIAAEMSNTIEDLGDKRALLIARTETAYAQAQGQLTGFRELGIAELGLLAEVLTAEDDRVCPECEELASKGPYKIEDAGDLIPVHPACRCAWAPILAEDVATKSDDNKDA